MLRTSCFAVTFLSFFAAYALEQPVVSNITAVKVFLSGAEVTRTGRVDLAKGTSTVLFAGLSEEVDPSNIQVSGSGAFTILGVQHRLNYIEEKQDRAEVAELKDRIKALTADITKEQSLLNVLEKEDARLSKNEVIAGQQGLGLEQLKGINDYLQSRQTTLALQRNERQDRIAELHEALAKLNLQLAQVQGKKTRPTSEVLVEVSAASAAEVTLMVRYMVRSAGWSPNYDIRVTDITKPLQLTYKAQVFQNTGEDWNKVQLALSSGEPDKDAIMPELYPWRLDFGYVQPATGDAGRSSYNGTIRDVRGIIRDAATGEPLPFVNVVLLDESGRTMNGAATNVDGYYAIAVPAAGRTLRVDYVGYQSQTAPISNGTMNFNLAASAVQLNAVTIQQNGTLAQTSAAVTYLHAAPGVQNYLWDAKPSRRIRRQKERYGEDDAEASSYTMNTSATTTVAAAVVQRTTNFEFPISVPYTIPSDGKNHQVGVQENELKGTYKYYCRPKLDLDAFLFAEVTGWEGMNLLPGAAYIYFEGTFVGESLLDLIGVGDTLDISLGRDQGVSVQRTKRKEFCQRQVIGGKRTESVAWEIAVRNNKPQPVDLVITDQFPVAVRSEIEVKLDDAGGASVNVTKGFLTWKFTVEPRTNRQLPFGYSVKVPKEQVVVLE